ncbi:MAG TPA: putative lipid II flippase FtsW [Polyangiales bacterium]|nr:putative lipid II flippase FtsW [Polyangiales bacterium]
MSERRSVDRKSAPRNTRHRRSVSGPQPRVRAPEQKSRGNVRISRSSAEPVRASIPEPARVSRTPEPVIERWPIITGSADPWLTALVWGLIAFGLVMVYSASGVTASQGVHQDPQYFLVKQGIFACIGLTLMHLVARVDYHWLKSSSYLLLLGVVLMLAFVALGFGHKAGGAARWIPLGPIHVQPVEIAKVAWVCGLAYSLSRKGARIRSFKIGFLPHVLGATLLFALCMAQPDFGSGVMIVAITFLMMFAAGASTTYLAGAVLLGIFVGRHLILHSPYRLARLKTFLEPELHRQGAGYQLWEAWMGFGSGGVSGLGLGHSQRKLLFLPEAHTDFISAIVGEELGLIGFGLLAAAFAFLIYRGLRAAFRAADEHGTYLATGLTLLVGVQAFTNLAVAVGLLPTKGLVLPFISYGGSSLLMNCVAVGILLNVSKPRVSVSDAAAGGARSSLAPHDPAAALRDKLPKVAGGVS